MEGLTAILPEGARVVNIGAWAGCSTVAMLRGARDIEDFHLYSVDIEPRPEEMEYVRDCGLVDPERFTQICGDSKVVGLMWTDHLDLVFVDGDHSYDGCKGDIDVWGRVVAENGYLAIHDYEAFVPEVTRAVNAWFADAVKQAWRKVGKVDTIVAFKRGWPHANLPKFPDSLPMKFAKGEI